MHSSDDLSSKQRALVMPAMVEPATQSPATLTKLAPPPELPAIPTPTQAEPTTAGAKTGASAAPTNGSDTPQVGPFDRAAALKVLAASAGKAARCRSAGAAAGSANVIVSIDPSGKIQSAKIVAAPYAGTPTAKCITERMAESALEPFSGEPQTLSVPVQVY